MDKVPFLDLKAQHLPIADEMKDALGRVVDSGAFVLGPEVEGFEEKFADFAGAKYAVCVNSGTSAIQLALLCAGVCEGDEVIVPAMTFIATAMAASYIGAKPVCVDVDDFCTMNPELVRGAVTSKTKAVVPVHLYGQSADMEPILSVARETGIAVVEDAAQSHGASYRGGQCGTFGLAAAWSFYPGKNLGALGEGGAVTTDSEQVAENCRMLRDWGQHGKGNHVSKGFNYRMDAFQGAVLGVKTDHICEWTQKRIDAALIYREMLSGVSAVKLPELRKDSRHVNHVFAVMVGNRDKVAERMRKKGVGTSVHYPCPTHLHPCYAELGYKKGDFPVAEAIAENELSLPMFPDITAEQIERVVAALSEAVG